MMLKNLFSWLLIISIIHCTVNADIMCPTPEALFEGMSTGTIMSFGELSIQTPPGIYQRSDYQRFAQMTKEIISEPGKNDGTHNVRIVCGYRGADGSCHVVRFVKALSNSISLIFRNKDHDVNECFSDSVEGCILVQVPKSSLNSHESSVVDLTRESISAIAPSPSITSPVVELPGEGIFVFGRNDSTEFSDFTSNSPSPSSSSSNPVQAREKEQRLVKITRGTTFSNIPIDLYKRMVKFNELFSKITGLTSGQKIRIGINRGPSLDRNIRVIILCRDKAQQLISYANIIGDKDPEEIQIPDELDLTELQVIIEKLCRKQERLIMQHAQEKSVGNAGKRKCASM